MESEHVKVASIAGWILAVGVLGYISGITSLAGLTVLAAVAVIPPVVVMKLWRVPSQSMSESIQNALR
jgi:hypothetical protein